MHLVCYLQTVEASLIENILSKPSSVPICQVVISTACLPLDTFCCLQLCKVVDFGPQHKHQRLNFIMGKNGKKSSHSDLLGEEQQATGCTPPNSRQ
ncbi:hypothetical protein PFLUV_G00247030 [Perca fluviatilis]|uniref:Uncharacterized protein n=1 Tax=Perca fluviatilis TaxID=8168 RepID=A0A6A5DX43_PERFL|nr:hypothetical protein PFLUV_G00247030 [Perca fluviatilis]